jgi:hypothetical protein
MTERRYPTGDEHDFIIDIALAIILYGSVFIAIVFLWGIFHE